MRMKTRASLSALAAFTLVAGVQGMTSVAQAAEEPPESSYTLNFKWKAYDSNPGWTYDQSRTGTKKKMRMYCTLYGKTSPDAAEKQIPAYEWADVQVTYGEKSSYVVKTPSTRTVDGTDYVDVHINACYHVMNDEEGFARDLATSHSTVAGTNVDDISIFQQANTDFEFVLTEGVIHPEDADGVSVKIGLNRTYKGTTEENFKGKSRQKTVNTYNFKGNAVHHPSAEYNADRTQTPITRAASGNDLDIFSPYTGRIKTYALNAKFADTGGVVNANGRYEIEKVEGDDLTGWTVYVKSNVKEVAPEKPTTTQPDKCGEEATVNLPKAEDPDNPVWIYEETRVNAKGEPDEKGQFVKVTAKLADPVLYIVKKDETTGEPVQTEWTFDIAAAACPAAPNWDDVTTPADKPVVVPNHGGPVADGATVQVKGPGTAVINDNGNITVTPNSGARVGDVITVTVLDRDGKVLDSFQVTLTKVDQVITVKPAADRKGLARTGADLGMSGAAAALALLAGASTMILARRRR